MPSANFAAFDRCTRSGINFFSRIRGHPSRHRVPRDLAATNMALAEGACTSEAQHIGIIHDWPPKAMPASHTRLPVPPVRRSLHLFRRPLLLVPREPGSRPPKSRRLEQQSVCSPAAVLLIHDGEDATSTRTHSFGPSRSLAQRPVPPRNPVVDVEPGRETHVEPPDPVLGSSTPR